MLDGVLPLLDVGLEALLADSPGLRPHLLGEDGKLRNFVNVFVNGDDVRALETDRFARTDDGEIDLQAGVLDVIDEVWASPAAQGGIRSWSGCLNGSRPSRSRRSRSA